MIKTILVAPMSLILLASTATFAQSDKDKDTNKDKKGDNSETYTVHKSGDAHNGVPTYSTGGLNPNPDKPKKESKSKEKKNKKN